jgi:uncharacterized protein (TIGR02453 family)
MSEKFTVHTFKYFDDANKNINKRAWFEKNQDRYQEHVKEPFSFLINQIKEEIQLPKILIHPKKITRPLRPKNREKANGAVKNFTHATFWEKKTSIFEWNPAIHIQFGANKDDNLVGVGLYMVSGRQIKALREELVENYDVIKKILKDRKFKNYWGELEGERYKRFPKGFDPKGPGAEYLWHKQFYVGRPFTRTEVKSKNFNKELIKGLKVSMPFFKWVRRAVGTYKAERSDFDF